MSKYEDYINSLDELIAADESLEESLEGASEALAWIENMNTAFRESGVQLPETPDLDKIEAFIDTVFMELMAATLFLNYSPELKDVDVPARLRQYAGDIKQSDKPFTDPSGHTGTSVPPAVLMGFTNLASRLEASLIRHHELRQGLKNHRITQKALDSTE